MAGRFFRIVLPVANENDESMDKGLQEKRYTGKVIDNAGLNISRGVIMADIKNVDGR